MSVAFDQVSNHAGGTGALSWTHTPVGTPKGILVFVVQNVGTGDEVTGVTYGGVTMNEVTGSPRLHATGEPGAVYCYFLGSGIPTGAQTVIVSVNGTGSSKRAAAISVTGATSRTKVQTSDATISSDSLANPSVTLNLSGVTSFCALALHSGQQQPTGITPLTNWNARLEHDFGSQVAGWYTYDVIGSANVTAGFTQTAEDAVMIAVAVTEDLLPLAADVGAFTLTGQSVALGRMYQLVGGVGSFALTGQAVTLAGGHPMVAGAGAYTVTGQSANLIAARRLVAELGDDPTITDWETGLYVGRVLAGETGSFAVTGQDASLDYAASTSFTLTADSGGFVLTGQGASLLAGRNLVSGAASFTVSGQDADLEAGRRVITEAAPLTLTAQAAGLAFGHKIAAEGASFTLAGQATGVRVDRWVSADAASFTFTGQGANLARGYAVETDAGEYDLTGQDANLKAARHLAASSSSFTLTGSDAGLVYQPIGGFTLAAQGANYSAVGEAVGLIAGRRIIADAGGYSVDGQVVQFARGRKLVAESAVFAITASDISPSLARVISATVASFSLTGLSALFTHAGIFTPSPARMVAIGPRANRIIIDESGRAFVEGTNSRRFITPDDDRNIVIEPR